MPVKFIGNYFVTFVYRYQVLGFIGNYFVTFVYRYQVLGFIGNYAVCELPIKSIGKCFITAI